MSLVVDLGITSSAFTVAEIEKLVIRRLEPLNNKLDPDDETHHYLASLLNDGKVYREAEFSHRYGDGGWICTSRALHALGLGVV